MAGSDVKAVTITADTVAADDDGISTNAAMDRDWETSLVYRVF